MTPIEAQWLDPQQRKILEVSYECLENAGLTLEAGNRIWIEHGRLCGIVHLKLS